MIVIVNQIALYGKKVTTDLATRVGPCTLDSYSYGIGMKYQVQAMWSGEETEANIEALFNEQADFDADLKQPHLSEDEYDAVVEEEEYEIGQRYKPAIDKTDFDGYYRRLEDIAPAYLESYIGNLVFTICRRNSGLKQFNSRHMEQPVLLSQGDDEGDFTELADLQLMNDDKDWPLDVKNKAQQRLSYVVKRLHNMSCYTGIHMLSYIVSFLKARDKNENMRAVGSQKLLKKNAVIEEGVYLCDSYGNIKKRVLVQNKNKRAEEAFNWICGISNSYQSYYQDYLDFVNYIDILNIDIENDDFTKYQSSFIDKLVVTIVTPNRQYDPQIYETILRNGTNSIPAKELEDPIESTINTFRQICTLDSRLIEADLHCNSIVLEMNTKKATGIHAMHYLNTYDIMPKDSDYKWSNGYLMFKEELVIIPASMISNSETRVFNDDRCIINELGYCIHVSNLMNLYIMSISDAYDNLRNKLYAHDPYYKYAEWMKIGI